MKTENFFFLNVVLLTMWVGVAVAQDGEVAFAKIQPEAHHLSSGSTFLVRDLDPTPLTLRSESAIVSDPAGNIVYSKHADQIRPIASITKLMTAMVLLDAGLPMEEKITIQNTDRDTIRGTGSRLQYGATLTRDTLVRLMLMASENRAANALARTYPNGTSAFVEAMNRKALELGMHHSHFDGPAGLHAGNMASARDIVTMVLAAQQYPLIREATTTESLVVKPFNNRGELQFPNTNRLLKNDTWSIQLSKTGYIREAGRCLVMQAEIADQSLVIVLLNAYGKLSPYGDSNRIRKWIEASIARS